MGDTMAQPKPHLSITLPRSFQFHYPDGQPIPQTPAAQPDLGEISEPPPPPKQTFKVRRRRADAPAQEIIPDTTPLPTIEMTEAGNVSAGFFDPSLTPGYLAPHPAFLRLVSPPRTPASQLTTYSTDSAQSNEWSMIHDVRGNPIQRPQSACSSFSDSSAASFGSSNQSHSLGGSCTSPESDAADPFSFYEVKGGPPVPTLLPSSTDLPTAKRMKTSRHPKWTPEMDNHLWITYMIYVQDPRVTPFKMLPGTPPPLGVCHRVAREAKRTWKGHRAGQSSQLIPRISIHRAGSPEDTVQTREDRSTPTPADFRQSLAYKWPRSEAATRRRLRELCKRKPSLSAHYMRLLRTRSPSPFESSSSPAPESNPAPDTSASAFSSRDMNVSLVAATAASMQADGPLAQLSKGSTPVAQAPAVQRPTDWFARIGRSQARAQAHQKSQSLQLGLGLNTWSGPNNTFERGSILASPFDSDVGRDSFLPNTNTTQSWGRGQLHRRPESSSSFTSPMDVHAPMPTVRSLKRRFGVDDESQTGPQSSLQNLFATPSTIGSRPPRNRGFSLGDMGVTTPNIASFFPLPPPDQLMEEAPEIRPNTSYLATPRSQEPPRLGSPFGGSSSNNRSNTFPRRFTPQENQPQDISFEEKLRQLSATVATEK